MDAKATGGRQRRVTLVAASVLVAMIAVAVAYQGVPVFTGLRVVLPSAELPTARPGEAGSESPAPREAPQEVRVDLSWLVFALIAVGVVVALALLWRFIRRRLARMAPAPLGALAGTEPGEVPAEPDRLEPEHVRRGLDKALDQLAQQREPRDAIERAWLGLEEGAADSGVRRLPAETPGEFTSRVMARVAADRAAARSLLELYLRARFSDAPVTPGDVDAARAAISVLRASWRGAAARDGGAV